LQQDNDDIEEVWLIFNDTVNSTAESILGKRRGKRGEIWLSNSNWKAVDERKALKAVKEQTLTEGKDAEAITEEYKIKDKEVKKRCKQDKEKWLNHKAMEA